jgi:hypothetical protein
MICPRCGAQVSEGVPECPNCHTRLDAAQTVAQPSEFDSIAGAGNTAAGSHYAQHARRVISVPSVEDETRPLTDATSGQTLVDGMATGRTQPARVRSGGTTAQRPVVPEVQRTQVYSVQQRHAYQERAEEAYRGRPAPQPAYSAPAQQAGYVPQARPRVVQSAAGDYSQQYAQPGREMKPIRRGPSVGSIFGLVLGLAAIYFSIQPWFTLPDVGGVRIFDLPRLTSYANQVLSYFGATMEVDPFMYGYLGLWALGCVLTVVGGIVGIASRRKGTMIFGLVLLLLVAGAFIFGAWYVQTNYAVLQTVAAYSVDLFQPGVAAGCALLGIILGAAIH